MLRGGREEGTARAGDFVQCQASASLSGLLKRGETLSSSEPSALEACVLPTGPCVPAPAYVTFPKPDPEERGEPNEGSLIGDKGLCLSSRAACGFIGGAEQALKSLRDLSWVLSFLSRD